MATTWNAFEALRAYLVGISAVTDVVGTAIYTAGGFPNDYAGSKAVRLIIDGGDAPQGVPIHTPRVDVRCYGSTSHDAYAVWQVIHDAMHDVGPADVTVTGGFATLARSWMQTGPTEMVEPKTQWRLWTAIYNQIWYNRVWT